VTVERGRAEDSGVRSAMGGGRRGDRPGRRPRSRASPGGRFPLIRTGRDACSR
jgi:hypothetical protein